MTKSASLGLLLTLGVVATSSAQPSEFVPGEVLIRFAPGSNESRLVLRAGEKDPPDLAALAEVTDALSRDICIPLRVSRLSSGDWVMLSVDVDRLSTRVADELRQRENVTDARPIPDTTRVSPDATPLRRILIGFRAESREAKAIDRELRGVAHEPLIRLVDSLEKDLAVPLHAKARTANELVVAVDIQTLTPELVERLEALPHVQAAQLNYILRPFGPGPS